MDLSENRSNNPNLIIQATANQCVIGNQSHTQSIIIPSDDQVIACAVKSINDLAESNITKLCEYQPEVVIIATGSQIEFPETDILNPLVKQNIGLEILNNQAAAFTFNVLLSENRKAVCLMMINPAEN